MPNKDNLEKEIVKLKKEVAMKKEEQDRTSEVNDLRKQLKILERKEQIINKTLDKTATVVLGVSKILAPMIKGFARGVGRVGQNIDDNMNKEKVKGKNGDSDDNVDIDDIFLNSS